MHCLVLLYSIAARHLKLRHLFASPDQFINFSFCHSDAKDFVDNFVELSNHARDCTVSACTQHGTFSVRFSKHADAHLVNWNATVCRDASFDVVPSTLNIVESLLKSVCEPLDHHFATHLAGPGSVHSEQNFRRSYSSNASTATMLIRRYVQVFRATHAHFSHVLHSPPGSRSPEDGPTRDLPSNKLVKKKQALPAAPGTFCKVPSTSGGYWYLGPGQRLTKVERDVPAL